MKLSNNLQSFLSHQIGRRSFRTSSIANEGLFHNILHGSPEASAEQALLSQQHSKLVGRNKYVHEFQTHRVLPGKVQEYKEIIGDYYDSIAHDPKFHCRLTGSWQVVVGDLDTFTHIWEYDGFEGFDASKSAIIASSAHQETFQSKILPLLQHRHNQLCQEFAFWPSSPPKEMGGIFELRSYTLRPGSLLEWEHEWRKGLEARRHFVEPCGAWFSQVGLLHQVHHLWQYPDLETRHAKRAEAWKIEGWSETVTKTVKLSLEMQANILKPLPHSPLK